MKLWRKLGKKEEQEDGTIKRTGRAIKYEMQMTEMYSKNYKKSNRLLDALLVRSGMTFVLSAKQINAYKELLEKQNTEEVVDESK